MNNSKIFLAVILMASGCAFNSTRTPVGSKSSGMIGAGLISWNNTNTEDNFEKNCRQWLKPGIPEDPVTGKPEDMALPDRSIYATCFANHMQSVDPGMGQQSAPVPVDINGDGMPDYFQYGGVYVPANVFNAYGIPGYYAPGAVGGGSIGVGGGFSNAYYQFPGQINMADLSSLNPANQVRPPANTVASTAPQSNKGNVNDPWTNGKTTDPKSDDAPATKRQLKIVFQQVKDVSAQQADLADRVNKVAPPADDKQTKTAAPKAATTKTTKRKSSRTEDL